MQLLITYPSISPPPPLETIQPYRPSRHDYLYNPLSRRINYADPENNNPFMDNQPQQTQTQIQNSTTPFMFIEKDKDNKYLKPISQEKLFEMNQDLFRKRRFQRNLPANRYKRKIY